MGLLDVMDDPRSMGLLSLGLRLMSTPGRFGTALGQAGMGAMGDYQSAVQTAEQRKFREQQMALQQAAEARAAAAEGRAANLAPIQQEAAALQLRAAQQAAEQAAQQRAAEEEFRRSIPNPTMSASGAAMANGRGPTVANATAMRPVDPQTQLLYNAMRAGQIKPMEYITATAKDDAPVKLGEGETLLSGKASGFKTLATGRAKEDDFIRNLRAAGVVEGSPQWNQLLLAKAQKDASHQPPTNVNVSMDKGFGDAFAKDAASALAASRDQAQSAANNLRTLGRIDEAINSGKVAVGPTAKFETFGRQLGQSLGVAGKDNAEVLGNTRKLLQGAASLAADGAKLLAGQGQITEGERALIARASGSDIDNMTVPEIQAMSIVLRKVNSFKIQQHDAALKNVGSQFAPFVPFYKVAMPEAPAIDFGSLK